MRAFTIYRNPSDIPDQYVMREYELKDGKPVALAVAWVAPLTPLGLETLRDMVRRQGLTCFPREDADDPAIVETWL